MGCVKLQGIIWFGFMFAIFGNRRGYLTVGFPMMKSIGRTIFVGLVSSFEDFSYVII